MFLSKAALLPDIFGQRPICLLLVDKGTALGFLPGQKIPLGIFLEHPLIVAEGIEL